MGSQRRGRSERDTIGYLTERKVQDMATKFLNERDYEILKLLDRFTIMTSEQIYKLVPDVGGYKAFTDLSTGEARCNKRLRALFDNHFINKYSPQLGYCEGTSKQYCWLDRAGKYVLSGDLSWKPKKKLSNDYLHYAAIVDSFIYFKELNDKKKNSVRYFRNEPKQETTHLIPDLVVAINDNSKPKLYLIEIDRGTKRESDEVDKIRKYYDWKESYIWRQEEWARLVENCPFPEILYVVDDSMKYYKGRIARLKKAINGYNIDVKFNPLTEVFRNDNYFLTIG